MLDLIIKYGKLIKFSHSIFAMPFALASVLLCYQYYPQLFTWEKLFWIIIAMVSARSSAMGFNRFADKDIDAKNPRTEGREIPRGVISPRQTLIFVILSGIIFVFSASRLNELAFILSPVALAVILGYSFTKRFTHLSHFVLGAGLGLAPLGAWIAIAGNFDWIPVVIATGVMFWVAGFDVIYSCQDYEFDILNGMHSLPAKNGIRGALFFSKFLHIFAAIAFALAGNLAGLSWIYYAGILAIVLLMVYESRLINEKNLAKINMAFFNLNGMIAVLYLIIVSAAVWLI